MDGGAAVPGRMMSQAVGAAALPVVGGGGSASSGPQGSSAFTYGGMWRGGQIFFKMIYNILYLLSLSPSLSPSLPSICWSLQLSGAAAEDD